MNRSTLKQYLLASALASAAGVLGGCNHDDPPVVTSPGAPLAPASTTTPPIGATMAQPANGADGWGLPPDLTGLDDPQLAGMVQAIRQADVDHLQLALTRSSNPDLLSFARDGIQVQRTAASQDAVDLAQLSVIPTSSVVSHQVLADWERDRSQLQVPLPSEFDRVFIDHHVTRDLRAVALLDAAIDEARSPALRAHLQSDRTTIAGHMREAQRLQLILRSPGP